MKIELRDYQEKQFYFLKDRIDFHKILGIESPTGSGKTVLQNILVV